MSCVIARPFPLRQGLPSGAGKVAASAKSTSPQPARSSDRSRRISQLAAALLDGTRRLLAGHDIGDLEEIVRIALGAVRLTDEDIRHQLMVALAEIDDVLNQPALRRQLHFLSCARARRRLAPHCLSYVLRD